MTEETSNENSIERPEVIESLMTLGYVIFWLCLICAFGAFYIACEPREMNSNMLALGVALIFSGWAQAKIIHGFAAVIEQLFEIRKNTSK